MISMADYLELKLSSHIVMVLRDSDYGNRASQRFSHQVVYLPDIVEPVLVLSLLPWICQSLA